MAPIISTPIIVYYNLETDKTIILSNNKGKAGIYQWTHKESGKIYVGSAFDLYNRFKQYFSKGYLRRYKNSYIYNALLHHGHSSFNLSILEYIDISNLSTKEKRELLKIREQYYLDKIFLSEPKLDTYNILSSAGSSLGYVKSPETKALISKALIGIPRTSETKVKISASRGGGTIYQYDLDGSLVNTFCSTRKAAEHIGCSHTIISRHIKNGKLFRRQWKFTLIEVVAGSSEQTSE